MAVYTAIDEESLDAFLRAYDVGEAVSVKGIAEGVENSNYLLMTEEGRYILTLYEKRVDPDDLPFFLGLMDHLAAKGVRCPTPIHGRDGQALRALCGRPAALIGYLDGVWPMRIQPFHCAGLGKALARDASCRRRFRHEPRERAVDRWLAPAVRGVRTRGGRCASGACRGTGVRAERDRAGLAGGAAVRRHPCRPLPGQRVFSTRTLSGLIDFYFACNDLLIYDIAICLNAWCFEVDGAFNITKARHLLANYRRVRPLSDGELDALPLLARGAALRFLLTRLYDWQNQVEGALVKPKDPLEYLEKLRFHQGVSGPGAYGLD